MLITTPLNNIITPFDRYNIIKHKFKDSPWIIISFISLALSLIFFNDSIKHMLALIPLSIGIGLVPLFVRNGSITVRLWELSVYKFVKAPITDIKTLFDAEFAKFSSIKTSSIFGFIFAVIAFMTFVSVYRSFEGVSVFKNIIAIVILIISSFICGIGLLSVFDLAKLFWKLGKFPVRVEQHDYGILGAGKKLLHCYSLASAAWFIYGTSAASIINYSLLPYYILGIPSFLFIILSFIFALSRLHFRMIEDKQERLYQLQTILQEIDLKDNSDLSKDRFEKIDYMNKLISQVNSLPEWPFNFKVFSRLLGSAIGAVLPNIISILLKTS